MVVGALVVLCHGTDCILSHDSLSPHKWRISVIIIVARKKSVFYTFQNVHNNFLAHSFHLVRLYVCLFV